MQGNRLRDHMKGYKSWCVRGFRLGEGQWDHQRMDLDSHKSGKCFPFSPFCLIPPLPPFPASSCSNPCTHTKFQQPSTAMLSLLHELSCSLLFCFCSGCAPCMERMPICFVLRCRFPLCQAFRLTLGTTSFTRTSLTPRAGFIAAPLGPYHE